MSGRAQWPDMWTSDSVDTGSLTGTDRSARRALRAGKATASFQRFTASGKMNGVALSQARARGLCLTAFVTTWEVGWGVFT